MIIPQRLSKGETVGIVAPAGVVDRSKLNTGIVKLESLGFKVKVGQNVLNDSGYLAGSDDERLHDFHEMIGDTEVKAVIFARGGYGTARLLDKIEYSLIEQHPKLICGYSDATALHLAILKKTGLITFSGPMAATDFGRDDLSELTINSFLSAVSTSYTTLNLALPGREGIRRLIPGQVSGLLIGGCLSIIVSMLGTPYFPDLSKDILVLEDIGEDLYRIDRMINSLRLNKVFEKVGGVVLGSFINESEDNYYEAVCSIVLDALDGRKIPVACGFDFGHKRNIVTLPVGAPAQFDADNLSLTVTAPVVN